jgi:hypothetical protein
MVTPPYKGGGLVTHLTVFQFMSPDGAHVIGSSFGGFGGTENDEENSFPLRQAAVYEFSRTPSGWATEALAPPASQFSHSAFVAASASLNHTLWGVTVQPRPGEELIGPATYMLEIREPGSDGSGRFVPIGPENPPGGAQEDFTFAGASSTLSHVVYSISAREGALWPGDHTRAGDQSLYEYAGTGEREPELVGVSNVGRLIGTPHLNEGAELISECGVELGSGEHGSTFNAISSDGAVVYFTALHGACASPAADEVYARVNGSRTVAVSGYRSPECTGPCAAEAPKPASFEGASEGGSKVFFTTAQPLLNSDGDGTGDLYEAELGAAGVERLTQISRGAPSDPSPGTGADVVGVARISADGSHVYFVAKGVLTRLANAHGEQAQAGGFNLYGYDTATGRKAFIATLVTPAEIIRDREAQCAGEEEGFFREQCELRVAGELDEIEAAKAGVPHADKRRFATTYDGRFLVFLSARDLTGGEDTSTVNQAFEYDAATDTLVRVSVGQKSAAFPQGFNGNGNTTNSEDAPHVPFPAFIEDYPAGAFSDLAVAEDGSVFFASRMALTPQATTDSGRNVYEYRAGDVYLLSAAGDPSLEAATFGDASDLTEPDEISGRLLGTNADGTDVFFATTSSLLPQDTDSQADWYVARVEGGFQTPAPGTGCAADACQGPLAASPAMLTAGSATQPAGENVTTGGAGPVVRRVTRAEQLLRALKDCRRKARKQRLRCEARARRQYGGKGHGSRRHGKS